MMPRSARSTATESAARSSSPGLAGADRHGQGPILRAALERQRIVGRHVPGEGVGTEGIPPGQVEVHRAAARRCLAVGAAGGRAQVQQARVVGLVGPDLTEPSRGCAVEADLVDRLAGADAPELGRAIRGQDDQRHARLVGLDNGGVKVRRRGTARAGDDRRLSRSPAPPRGRRSRQPARRGSPSARSQPRDRGRARSGSSANRGRGRHGGSRSEPAPRRAPMPVRCSRWSCRSSES